MKTSAMDYGSVPGIDKPVSRLVQGTVMVDGQNEAKEFALLDAVFDMGCTAFDTGHVYSNGANERAVGRWLRNRGLQDEVVLIGKGAHHNEDRKRVTPFDIAADLHDSLARFGLETIDLYLLHRDDESVPVGPIVEALNEHRGAGRIRAFGGSNWSFERIKEANAYAREHGLTPFVASSPNFSLAEQIQEPWEGCVSISGEQGKAARDYYAAQDTPLFTWSSLAGGFFSGRFKRDNLESFETYLDKLCVSTYASEENFQRLDHAEELARAKNVTVAQLVTAYVMRQPLNIFALVGCRTPEEFRQNVAAMNLDLSEDEAAQLERPS